MSANLDQTHPHLPECVELSVSNIGGIDETTVSLREGVTVLSGRNATNRTSLLQGLMAALGSERASLKADETLGTATLEADDSYTGRLERQHDTVQYDGQPYLDDPELADLFAFLLESNEARQAVTRGEDLRELIMRPVDTAAINDEIARLESEKRDLDDRLSELESLEQRLPELEQTKQQLADEIEQLRADLSDARANLAEAEIDPAEGEKRRAELQSTLDALQEARSEIEQVRDRIETERESIEALRSERQSIRGQLDDVETDAEVDLSGLESDIEHCQEKKAALDAEISQLQQTIQFNRDRLDGDDSMLSDGGDVTGELLPGGEVTCWTCGSTVEADRIEQTIDQLRELRRTKADERSTVESELADLRDRKDQIESTRRERRDLEDRLATLKTEIEQREERKADLLDRRDSLSERIDDLETAVDELDAAEYEEIATEQKRASELSVQLDSKEQKRAEIDAEIEQTNRQIEQREQLRTQREQLTDQLTDLRTRIDRLEAEAVEQFNTHMETLLDLLGYENIERIWIERIRADDAQSTTFELRIVRTTADGTAYEDSIDHLSESEREVTGLVFALAGYLVHDLHESVPFMLLDSLEAIDSERIATLVEYFQDFVPYLVVALLEEDAQALADDHNVVSEV
ncbi:archaea-specific SMC-related protein [Halovenus sp. HT40]|uniref:archaea-specific SMC-related protein n=1 Tax=Halovenus sp. HT40 TaxID=3126691 RepID=UPI00300EE0EB